MPTFRECQEYRVIYLDCVTGFVVFVFVWILTCQPEEMHDIETNSIKLAFGITMETSCQESLHLLHPPPPPHPHPNHYCHYFHAMVVLP